ncbi:hypothetical protein BV25DRAFT_1827771 [Artomyces pyxidatus]|uniref:Uncharacterized protein n=1 Tax=Artomyces pyxidatus TaxID=48021 RepID=A0ACB8SW34_9AGAM|nr:hypothetical protein BV25DRAFT_1827771 [Artomyces pyxidatus]
MEAPEPRVHHSFTSTSPATPLSMSTSSMLSHIAPSTVRLFLNDTNISDRARASALECWSHFLESLFLNDPGDEAKGRDPQADVNSTIASLPHL